MKPIEEITDLLGKARRFCASIPEGDERQRVNEMCETILLTLGLRVAPASPEAIEAIGLLRLMLSKLDHYLTVKDAMVLGLKVRQWEKKQSANASAPRKKVTKAELEAYRDERKQTHGTARGWKALACKHFGITLKTLNKKVE